MLPDACCDLIWQSGRGVFVAGPDTGPVLVLLPPGTVLAGVRLRPGAGGPALGLPLSELLDQRAGPPTCRHCPAVGARLARRGTRAHPGAALRLLVGEVGGLTSDSPADPLVAEAARRLARPGRDVGEVAARLASASASCSAGAAPRSVTARRLLRRVLRFRRFVPGSTPASRRAARPGPARRRRPATPTRPT